MENMSEVNKKFVINRSDFFLEEYKRLVTDINISRNRRYQIMVLFITGFVAVLGFSDKLIGIVKNSKQNSLQM